SPGAAVPSIGRRSSRLGIESHRHWAEAGCRGSVDRDRGAGDGGGFVKRAAVILAGGAGTRLRPLSSDENPKQFLRLFGGRSLIEMTYARVAPLASQVYVSTNERYAPLVREHVPDAAIIAEPARRNTAPAIALSCFTIEREIGDCVVAVLPSDHYIGDEQEFARVLGSAYDFAATHDELVTIGIE